MLRALFPFLVFTCCFPLTGITQNRTTDTSATCIAFWKNKEVQTYSIKHIKERNTENGNRQGSATYEAHIKITDSTVNGFALEWVFKNFKVEGVADEMTRSLGAAIEGMVVKYTTDEAGSFTELLNWEEVRDFAIGNVEKALTAITQNTGYKAALNQVKTIFQTRENIELLLIKEVKIFHAPYGVEYGKKGSREATLLPNATGGEPFPATITVKLEALNTTNDHATVSINQIIDKKKAAPIMAALLKKLAGGKPVNEETIKKEINGLEISDLNTYNFSLSTGWINQLTYKRIANIGPSAQTETYEITAIH